jgi:hypothetical protein
VAGIAVRPVGAPATVAENGVTAFEDADTGPDPSGFEAVTLKV